MIMTDTASLRDYYVEIKRGNIPGHSIVHKFGNNIIVPNGTWALVSPVSLASATPGSGSPVRIKAGGNVADDANGAGCRSIELVGINTDFEEVSEIMTTSGTGISATSVNSYWRLHRLKAIDVGTYGVSNTDVITFENADGSADRALMRAEEGQSQHAMWSSPSGQTAYLMEIKVDADTTKPADFRVITRERYDIVIAPMMSSRLKILFDGVAGSMSLEPKTPNIELPALTDIWVEARGAGNSTEVSVDMEILLIDPSLEVPSTIQADVLAALSGDGGMPSLNNQDSYIIRS